MKTLLLAISVLLSITTFSQTYLPMLEEDNLWNIDFITIDGDIMSFEEKISGETEFNGKIYKDVEFLSGNICYWREENGVVFQLDSNYEEEEILYDFSLEFGDVFVYTYYAECAYGIAGNGGVEFQVTSIETQFIAGENRKVIELKDDITFPYYTEYWIEGIGSLNGLNPHNEYVDLGYTKLVCFTKDGITTFFNGATACDNTTIGIKEFDTKSITLYPNPVINTSILNLPEKAAIDYIKIYDVYGRIIKNEFIKSNSLNISANEFSSGMYFYQLFSKDKMVKTDKFIIN